MTARAGTSLPSASTTVWNVALGRSPATSHGALMRAPSRRACRAARSASSPPESPLGNPT